MVGGAVLQGEKMASTRSSEQNETVLRASWALCPCRGRTASCTRCGSTGLQVTKQGNLQVVGAIQLGDTVRYGGQTYVLDDELFISTGSGPDLRWDQVDLSKVEKVANVEKTSEPHVDCVWCGNTGELSSGYACWKCGSKEKGAGDDNGATIPRPAPAHDVLIMNKDDYAEMMQTSSRTASHWYENVIWEARPGQWRWGIFVMSGYSKDTQDPDFDHEWDQEFDTSRFDYVGGPGAFPTGDAAFNDMTSKHGNPGSSTYIPHDDPLVDQYNQMFKTLTGRTASSADEFNDDLVDVADIKKMWEHLKANPEDTQVRDKLRALMRQKSDRGWGVRTLMTHIISVNAVVAHRRTAEQLYDWHCHSCDWELQGTKDDLDHQTELHRHDCDGSPNPVITMEPIQKVAAIFEDEEDWQKNNEKVKQNAGQFPPCPECGARKGMRPTPLFGDDTYICANCNAPITGNGSSLRRITDEELKTQSEDAVKRWLGPTMQPSVAAQRPGTGSQLPADTVCPKCQNKRDANACLRPKAHAPYWQHVCDEHGLSPDPFGRRTHETTMFRGRRTAQDAGGSPVSGDAGSGVETAPGPGDTATSTTCTHCDAGTCRNPTCPICGPNEQCLVCGGWGYLGGPYSYPRKKRKKKPRSHEQPVAV